MTPVFVDHVNALEAEHMLDKLIDFVFNYDRWYEDYGV